MTEDTRDLVDSPFASSTTEADQGVRELTPAEAATVGGGLIAVVIITAVTVL